MRIPFKASPGRFMAMPSRARSPLRGRRRDGRHRREHDMSITRRQFTPAAAASVAALAAAPAFGQTTNETIKWRLTSSFPKNLDTLWGASATIARVVGEMTDGKFAIQPFAAGEIVPG